MDYKKFLIGILDYECGNIDSLNSVIKSLGFNTLISKDKVVLKNTDLMILPGVGNFYFAMQHLKKTKMVKFIQDYSKNKPIIGICLGMQIFFSKGSETKNSKGLNLITGEIKKFDNDGVKIGWDKCRNKSKLPSNFIDQTEFFYFNHSFFASTKKRYILSYSFYEKEKYPAIIKKNNLLGFQFHPEKSQLNGKKLLKKAIILMLND